MIVLHIYIYMRIIKNTQTHTHTRTLICTHAHIHTHTHSIHMLTYSHIQRAMAETTRRRQLQTAYNAEHNITPTPLIKKISSNTILDLVAHNKVRVLCCAIDDDEFVTEVDSSCED